MSSAIQFKLATNFLPLVVASKRDVRQLRHILALCEVANEFASDDHSVGDEVWRDELLDTLKSDIAALSD